MNNQPRGLKAQSPALMLVRVLQGVLIGGGAILPGVSGGVLAVVFGVYQPMMELFANPIKTLRKHLWLFAPIIVGVALGFVGFAKLMGLLFAKGSPYPISLFVGLILGTVPQLFNTARSKEIHKHDGTALTLAIGLLFVFLLLTDQGATADIVPTVALSFISGIIWGFSLIVPGLSSSSILIAMGIYGNLMNAVGRMDFAVILPLIAGIALVAVLCARLVNLLLRKYFSLASHAIVGLVVASTLMIIPRSFSTVGEGLACLLLAALGFVGAWYLGVWGDRVRPQED